MSQEGAGMPEDENLEPTNDFLKNATNGKTIVAKMQMSLFRECLINQFDIVFKMKKN